MRRLPQIICLLGLAYSLQAQSPHGPDLKLNCSDCHSTDSWKIPMDSWKFEESGKPNVSRTTGWVIAGDTSKFNHYKTDFPLLGQHARVDCRACHETLVFSEAKPECINCHTDMHRTTVGSDCARCHTTEDWLVDNITELHFDNGFPLLGAHAAASCNDCHVSESGLEFNRIGNDCLNCHLTDYNATTNPNHNAIGLSTNCMDCHSMDADWIPADFAQHDALFPIYSGAHDGEWQECIDCHTNPSNYSEFSCITCHLNPETDNGHAGVGGYVYENTACLACHPTGDADNVFDHNMTAFPLTGAHTMANCADCHTAGYEGTPADCAACHTTDFNQSANPNHQALGFPTDCAACHTTEPGWSPATFDIHNDYYALNGAHAGIANDCAACHNGDYNNTPNTCAGCHTADYDQAINPNHQSAQFPLECESCHSETAWAPSTFDHNSTYPLTGAHDVIANDCMACHNGDYNNTPNTCAGCHTQDFNQSVNPNHQVLGFPVDCESCHTTEPGWSPATFDIHNDYYALNGAHAGIANDCAACHNGDYNNTPNTCAGCHTADYNQATNPNHSSAQFPTDCQSCHTEDAWAPSIFDHDGMYFPIYSGAHDGEWGECMDCHTNPSNYAEYSCTACHTNPETNNDHAGVGGYVYENTACLACHPTGNADDVFDHNMTAFPLTGAHTMANCADCHTAGYAGTPTDCAACHVTDFNQAANPNHQALGFPTDCAACHTTEPGWSPATFNNHNDYYALNGAHAAIANDCATCHNGDYNNTPNTCAGCHTSDYNQANDPNHASAGFPTTCESCHSETAWAPSTFDHDGMYFPIYSGKHKDEWDNCNECHTTPGNFTVFSCIDCHEHDNPGSLANDHNGVSGYVYESNACYSCHPTGSD